jgi:hypothetical protein
MTTMLKRLVFLGSCTLSTKWTQFLNSPALHLELPTPIAMKKKGKKRKAKKRKENRK